MKSRSNIINVSLIIATSMLVSNIYASISHTIEYEILSHQKRIGKIVATKQQSKDEVNQDLVCEMDLSPLGEKYKFYRKSEETWVDNSLNKFDHWLIENKERWHIKGMALPNDSLWVGGYQVKTKDQEDIDEISGLAGSIIANTVPYAGLALQVAGLFSNEEQEGEESIPFGYYDTLDSDLGKYLHNSVSWKGSQKIKVFSTLELELKKYKVQDIGRESIETSAGIFQCRAFKLESRKHDFKIWTSEVAGHGPTIIKEVGVEEGLDYQIAITNIR